MKTIIVIIESPTKADLENILRAATNKQGIPSEVMQISDTAFLIDIHKSLAFFSGLVHEAHIRHIPIYVFAVEDILHLPLGKENWGQKN